MVLRSLIVVLLLTLAVPASRAEEEGKVRVFFGPQPADAPRGIYSNLLRFLDSAKETLHGSCHEIDMVSVADKLVARVRDGVDVQVVVEAQWWEGAKNKAARLALERGKVKIVLDTKKSGLMHNKFFVADKKRVWTGSTNLTETCLLYNPNSAVWIESEKLAANFETKFADQVNGKFGKKAGKTPMPWPVVELDDGKRIHTYFSPENAPVKKIVELIDGTEKSIDVLCFVFSSEEITRALLAAQKRGVACRVLLDNLFASRAATARWKLVPFQALKAAGVSCKYDDEESKLHHKVVILDGKTVVCGSLNLSVNAMTENDENTLIIESPSVAKQFTAEFNRLWKQYKGDPGPPGIVEAGDDDAP